MYTQYIPIPQHAGEGGCWFFSFGKVMLGERKEVETAGG
jgi:hypothetical protein